MKKPKSQSAVSSKPKSEPLKYFEENLDQIQAFIKRMGASDLVRATEKVKRAIEKETAAASSGKVNMKTIAKAIKHLSATTSQWLEFYRPASRWIIVMLVSFLEGYLEDVLVEIALKNPKIVKGGGVPFAEIIATDSLEELKGDLVRNWAHDELRPNGPTKWYQALKGLGASPNLDQKIVAEVQHLWDTRNLIVHARCIPDKPYANKYASQGAIRGTELNVNMVTLQNWLRHVVLLVEWADAFLLNYKKSKTLTA